MAKLFAVREAMPWTLLCPTTSCRIKQYTGIQYKTRSFYEATMHLVTSIAATTQGDNTIFTL